MLQTENLISPPGSQTPPTKKVKTKYPKIFQCTGYGDCKMTFTRSEHLARHIRKHTGERPFSCHCSRSFSRLDNLRQHIQTVHANEQHIMHSSNNQQLHIHQHQKQQQHNNIYNKPLPQPMANSQDHIKIEPHSMMIDSPPPSDTPSFRTKHRPAPISLGENKLHTGQSPTSPMFAQNGNGTTNGNNVPNGYYNYPLPTTPVNATNGNNTIEPTTPTTPYGGYLLPYNGNGNSYDSNANSNNLRSYQSIAQLSSNASTTSTISRQPSTSSFSSPMYAQASNTSSWLSNVLCEPQDPNTYPPPQQRHHMNEDRPHTWGPSSNNHRLSSATDDGDISDRTSLSQLVRITEDAHISSPPPNNVGPMQDNNGGHLPSLTAIFNQQQQQSSVSASPTSANSSYNGSTISFGDNRPQLSATRSYTKNLILPRPESYPPPKGYVMTLPMADTRPPTVPPAGSERNSSSSTTRRSGSMTRFMTNLTKPLPPLPVEAQQQQASSSSASSSSSSSDGMDVLLQAAGV